jgi:hypothetical protein
MDDHRPVGENAIDIEQKQFDARRSFLDAQHRVGDSTA